MQIGLNKHLQLHEIKSYKHKIKNQTNKNSTQTCVACVDTHSRLLQGVPCV